MRLLPDNECYAPLGIGRSSYLQMRKDGFLPPPIKQGARNYMTDAELELIVRAVAAGADAESMRALSRRIERDRKKLMPEVSA